MTINSKMHRRDFVRSLLGASVAGGLGAMGQLALMREAAAAAPMFNDYKALVCIFLYGGNDSFNMLVPTGTDAKSGYNNYQSVRGSLAISNAVLDSNANNPYHVDGTEESAYQKGVYSLAANSIDLGVNGVMPELANLIKANKATIIANAGNLVEPVARTQIQNSTANLPVFLFTHNHQQRALQTGQGDNLHDVGWAGRIADNWSGINSNSLLGLNISYAGLDRMLIGNSTAPLALKPGEIEEFTGMQMGTTDNIQNDRRALFKALAGLENTSVSGNMVFNSANTYSTSDLFKNLYGRSARKSLDVFDLLYTAWNNHTVSYTNTDSYGNALFSVPGTADTGFSEDIGGGLIKDLETVAKMIDIGVNNAFSNPVGSSHNRQIFMVKLGGFDTHSGEISKHPLLLRELSLAIGKFQTALEELGHSNKVTTFTMSDFGRTMSNNGDGTDHAWGAHHLVVGGDGLGSSGNLNGGQMLGTLPDMSLGGADDHGSKGRIIPTIAQDQLNATLCRWFGVDDTLMPTIFPNLGNFGTVGSGAGSAYLTDLFT